MDQSNILQETINQFAQKFKKIAKVKIKDPVNNQGKEDQPLIMINVLGMEEIVLGNMNERIQRKGKDNKGNIIEYFTAPATLFNISVMVVSLPPPMLAAEENAAPTLPSSCPWNWTVSSRNFFTSPAMEP